MAKGKHPTSGRPKAYSYIRFSTPEQAFGDSERRQLELAKRFAERAGLELDTTLKMVDRGLSGYKGTNVKNGALGVFLELVRNGSVPRGSRLIVENVDRLSRQPFMDAFRIISDIITSGIVIQTLSPEAVYDEQTVNGGQVWGLVGQIQNANAESKKKSERLSQAWNAKRASGKPLTGITPEWLKKEEKNGRMVAVIPFKPIPEAAKTIRQIFKWKSEGVSCHQIVRLLNQGNYWKPSGKRRAPAGSKNIEQPAAGSTNEWRRSYVNKILVNRAVIGEFQPHRMEEGKRVPVGEPIKDYFPEIVSPGLFNRVQKGKKTGAGGQTGSFDNTLRYLCRCAYCGGSMSHINKGEPPKGARYLVCEAGTRNQKVCQRNFFRYDQVLALVLDNCPNLDPSLVLPSSGEAESRCSELRESIDDVDAQLSEIEKRLDKLVDEISYTESTDFRERLRTSVVTLESQQSELRQKKKSLIEELESSEHSLKDLKQWQAELGELRLKLNDKKGGVIFRQRTNHHLRELIDRIELFSRGYPSPDVEVEKQPIRKPAPEYGKNGRKKVRATIDRTLLMKDDIGLYLDAVIDEVGLKRTQEVRDFISDIVARRTTREGRFIRVFFKSGFWVDLAPPGSLASGYRYVLEPQDDAEAPAKSKARTKKGAGEASAMKGRWKSQAVEVQDLWDQFIARREKSPRKNRSRG